MKKKSRICTFCVMDDSNPFIEFDSHGQCNCCRDALRRRASEWWPDASGEKKMAGLAEYLRRQGKGKKYDAMVGLSGGIDSAYLAHIASRRYGLRLLAVHVDGGWNSEPAVANIEAMVRGLGMDFHTHVIEWKEMKDLQVSFLKASVLNQDMPQDHAFFATLYRTAKHFGISDFLSGVNFASENIVPPGFGYPSIDGRHIRAIHKRFGQGALRTYPVMNLFEYLWLTRVGQKLAIHKPLNFFNYDKNLAQEELKEIYGWRSYGSKHSESRFTKFYQDIYLPRKFNFDKRRLHLSSLIVSGQVKRDDALEELKVSTISDREVRRDIKFVAKKIGVSEEDIINFIDKPSVDHCLYPNNLTIFSCISKIKRIFMSIKLKK